MASTNKKNKAALNSIKMQAASEVGVPLKDNGYNGDLTSKQAGSIGGQMVKKICPLVIPLQLALPLHSLAILILKLSEKLV